MTGCTDGIGKAYSVELAKLGMNLVLVSRTKSKLDSLKADLEKDFGINSIVLAIDLTHPTAANWKELEAVLTSNGVGLVINNAATFGEVVHYH